MAEPKELFVDIDKVFRSCPTIVDTWKDMTGKQDVIDWEPCTVYETRFYTDDGYLVTFAWIIGRGQDNCATIAMAASKTGWVLGRKDYVIERPIPDKLIESLEGCIVKRLWLVNELPGFGLGGVHDCGWFSKGLFAIKEDHPAVCLGEGAKVWHIKEGVYIMLSKGSYRFMSHTDYNKIRFWGKPYRTHGDLLFYDFTGTFDIENGQPIASTDSYYTQYKFIPCPLDYHLGEYVITKGNVYQYVRCDGIDDPDEQIFILTPARIEHHKYYGLEFIAEDCVYEMRLLPGTPCPSQYGRID